MLIANDPCWIYFHDYNKTAPCGMITVCFFFNWNESAVHVTSVFAAIDETAFKSTTDTFLGNMSQKSV